MENLAYRMVGNIGGDINLADWRMDGQTNIHQCGIHSQPTMVLETRKEAQPFSSRAHSHQGNREGLYDVASVLFAVPFFRPTEEGEGEENAGCVKQAPKDNGQAKATASTPTWWKKGLRWASTSYVHKTFDAYVCASTPRPWTGTPPD